VQLPAPSKYRIVPRRGSETSCAAKKVTLADGKDASVNVCPETVRAVTVQAPG